MTKRTLLLVAATAFVATAHAQGGMMRSFQASPMASAMLLRREDVQEELKLTDEQKGKLDEQQASSRERMQDAFREARSNGTSRDDMMKSMMPLFESMAKDALGVLTDTQKKRLTELSVQSAGTLAVLRSDIAKELEITEPQKAKIDDLQRLQDDANQSLRERAENGDIEWSEVGDTMQKNAKTMDAEILKLLTPKQRTRLKELGGTPFEFKDPKPGTPGSFGRPGGGSRLFA